jgi:hypothetical protein
MPSIQSSAPGHVPNARIKTVVQEVLSEQPPGDHTHTIADVTGLASALADKASLVEGKVPASQLPSYVDDVLEFASFAAFPAVGESGKIYIDTATNEQYRWSGSAYISIVASPGSSDEVAEGATNKYYTDARAALKADVAHTHSIAHVTGLQTALEGKAAASHSHSWSNITDKPTTFTPATHGHVISDVAGLQTALDGKSETGHTHEIADITGLAAALAALQPIDTFRDNGSSSSVDWSLGSVQYIAATSNLALTFSGHVAPRSYELHILASGADRTITFPVNNEYAFSTRVLQIASGQKTTIVFRYLIIGGTGRYVAGFGPEYSMVTV